MNSKCVKLGSNLGKPNGKPNPGDEPPDEPPDKPPDINPVFDFGTNLGIDFSFDLSIDFGIGLGNGAHLGTNIGNDLSIDKNLGTDLGNGLGIDITFDFDVDYGVGTGFGNEEHSINLGNRSLSWNKFAPSRVWYKDSPYMLYTSLIDSTPTPNLGYCSILGYSVNGFKRCEASCLLDCIMDGCYDFIPTTIVTMFQLWNYIDFIFWMIFNSLNNVVCTTIANIIFLSIKHIIEPYCTIDVYVSILCVLFTLSILYIYIYIYICVCVCVLLVTTTT